MKYDISTEQYSLLNKAESEKAVYLMDSDNTTAYGIQDLKYKINELRKMNIEITAIYKCIKGNGTYEDVTGKYIKSKREC